VAKGGDSARLRKVSQALAVICITLAGASVGLIVKGEQPGSAGNEANKVSRPPTESKERPPAPPNRVPGETPAQRVAVLEAAVQRADQENAEHVAESRVLSEEVKSDRSGSSNNLELILGGATALGTLLAGVVGVVTLRRSKGGPASGAEPSAVSSV
jgi:hypothetical protein